jgi:phosphoribosylanthranilate isomerase
MGPSETIGSMTRTKICGLTTLDEAQLAVDLGAWAIGLIFHPDSPRRCDVDTAERIGAAMRRQALVTGVFVNHPIDEVALLAERCSLGMLQLHGDEGPAYCREAARRTGCRVMKAMPVRDAAAIRALEAFRVDFHLLDTHRPGRRGGTGETFQWELAAAHDRTIPVVLSGGLTAHNVADGIRATRPFAVDTASGTEAAPGRKDPAKLRAFLRAVEAADATISDEPQGRRERATERAEA